MEHLNRFSLGFVYSHITMSCADPDFCFAGRGGGFRGIFNIAEGRGVLVIYIFGYFIICKFKKFEFSKGGGGRLKPPPPSRACPSLNSFLTRSSACQTPI